MNGNGHVRSPLSLNPYREIWSLKYADAEIRAPRRRESVEILRERFENGNVGGPSANGWQVGVEEDGRPRKRVSELSKFGQDY